MRKPLYFQEYPIRILSLPCQPRVQFKQHPSSTWTAFWRPLLHYIQAPACCSGYITFFYIDIFSKLFSGFVVFNSFLEAVGEALHSLFYISFSEFAGTSTNSTISYLVSLCLVSVALFSCLQFQPIFYFINIFSTHMFLIFHMSLQDEDQGGPSTSSPTFHSLLLLECTLIVILY